MQHNSVHIIAALALSLCCLTGCSPPSVNGGQSAWNNTPTSSKSDQKGGITDGSGNFTYTGDLQQIGDEENGYMQVPADYIPFQEEGVEGMVQYADKDGSHIVTLDFYEDMDYLSTASSMYAYLEQEGQIQGLAYAVAEVNGYPAYQVYGYYDDGTVMVLWFIQDTKHTEDCYYVGFEYNGESDFLACSSTFLTRDDYQEGGDAQ